MMRQWTRIAGISLALAVAQSALTVTPVLAQAASDCVCVVGAGTVGSVSDVAGWVKLNGDVGLVDAATGAPISQGSVLTTGVAGSANVSMGGGCNVAVGGGSQLSVTPMEDGQMCVRVTDTTMLPETNVVAAVVPVGLGIGMLALGLGQDDPVSK